MLALGQPGEAALAAMLVEGRGEIGRHALHLQGADRLDARVLDGIEDLARRLVLRRLAGMELAVVMAQPQRDRIRRTAGLGDLLRRQIAGGQRQPRLAAREARAGRGRN